MWVLVPLSYLLLCLAFGAGAVAERSTICPQTISETNAGARQNDLGASRLPRRPE